MFNYSKQNRFTIVYASAVSYMDTDYIYSSADVSVISADNDEQNLRTRE